VAFVQPVVKIDNEREFEELRGLVSRALAPEGMERFLKQLDKNDIRVRHFEELLQRGILDSGQPTSGAAQSLYQALTVSDQAQVREFYLSKIEEVEPSLRHRFRKLYQYY
jgi:hypothetical protein